MTEIYWITRLDSITTFISVMLLFGILGFCAQFTAKLIRPSIDADIFKEDIERCDIVINLGKKLAWMLVIAIPALVFIPSTKEALLIYGVGNTIDYLTDNPHAQNIPDLALEALEKYAEDYIHKDESEK